MRKLLLVTGALWVMASTAYATAITPTTDLVVDFSGSGFGLTGDATAELTNFVFGPTSVTFQMDVTNTSNVPVGSDVRLTALGWVTAPATTTATDNTNIYAVTTNVGLGPANLSLCLYSGPNCNGGASGGVVDPADAGFQGDPTTTGVFDVTINFASSVPPLDFSQFDAKFQTAAGSFFATGTPSVTPPPPPPPPPPNVPEPATLALFLTALIGLGTVRYVKR